MFIGHFGIGFAGKKVNNKPSLGTLFFAAQFLDLLWPILLLAGIESAAIEPSNSVFLRLNFSNYPISHSLVGSLLWAILFGLIYFLFKKNLKASIVLCSLVFSHWLLDLIVHQPDLPISPWSNIKLGFGLWNSIILSVIIEGLIFTIGVYLYISSTKAKNKKGQFGLWSLIIFFAIIYLLNLFGSPPPSVQAVGIAGLFQWLFIPWAYWIDKNRVSVE